MCYLDDILITTRSVEEHKKVLSEVLQRLERHNIKAKLSKCEFFKSIIQEFKFAVNYLGYKIDKEGLHPTEEKVRAIIDAPVPTNVTELRS